MICFLFLAVVVQLWCMFIPLEVLLPLLLLLPLLTSGNCTAEENNNWYRKKEEGGGGEGHCAWKWWSRGDFSFLFLFLSLSLFLPRHRVSREQLRLWDELDSRHHHHYLLILSSSSRLVAAAVGVADSAGAGSNVSAKKGREKKTFSSFFLCLFLFLMVMFVLKTTPAGPRALTL